MKPYSSIIIISILLCIALAATIFAALTTVRAVHSFEQQHTMAKAGDVRTIRPWMTISYVAHTYHVPESYLYDSLHISDKYLPRHLPLHALAARYKVPESTLVARLQTAILTYRQQHKHAYTDMSMRWPSMRGRIAA